MKNVTIVLNILIQCIITLNSRVEIGHNKNLPFHDTMLISGNQFIDRFIITKHMTNQSIIINNAFSPFTYRNLAYRFFLTQIFSVSTKNYLDDEIICRISYNNDFNAQYDIKLILDIVINKKFQNKYN